MAHKKAAGSTSLGRDSQSKRLGVKRFAGQFAKTGMIIVKQRGVKIRPGVNVAKGKDDTLFATKDGTISFTRKRKVGFDGKAKISRYANVGLTK